MGIKLPGLQSAYVVNPHAELLRERSSEGYNLLQGVGEQKTLMTKSATTVTE